jgi:hypothetical protein
MNSVSFIRKFTDGRRYEVFYSLVGVLAGGLIGLFVGGIGVAALGGAGGFSGFIVCAIALGFVGDRIGVERDRKVLLAKTTNRDQQA